MVIVESLLKSNIAKGVAIGLGLTVVGVLLMPALRPVTRGAIKGGILAFEKSREWMAETAESLEDMVAEVRAGLAGELVDSGRVVEAALESEETAS